MTPFRPTQSVARHQLLVMLFGFSFLSYLLRMNISVAQQAMLPELGLSDIQIGAVFSAFMLGYSLLQVPAGILGDRFGPRPVLAVAALGWGILSILTGIVPGKFVRGALAAFVSLLILRFLLGTAQAATYPVAARAVANWIPESKHAFSNAVVIVGATVGSAVTGPLIAYVMQRLGWRATFYLTGLFPLIMAIVWWWGAPRASGEQTAKAEQQRQFPVGSPLYKGETSSWWSQVRNSNIAFLCMSYFLYSYVMFIFVFWLFKYLVDVRKFSVIGSGWATSLPFIAASVALPLFGYVSDWLSMGRGRLRGRRQVAMGCLVCAGSLLFVGAHASSALLALLAISLSVAFLFSTEGCYWSTAINLAGPHAGAAGGLMNMAGNLGGVVSTIAVPFLVRALGWDGMFALASALSILGAIFWLLIRSAENSSAFSKATGAIDPSDTRAREVSI